MTPFSLRNEFVMVFLFRKPKKAATLRKSLSFSLEEDFVVSFLHNLQLPSTHTLLGRYSD